MKSQARLSVRSINQSNRSISVRLSFLFCSRAFISRSYENRSILGCSVLLLTSLLFQLNLSTTATLGTEESSRRKEVVVVERFYTRVTIWIFLPDGKKKSGRCTCTA